MQFIFYGEVRVRSLKVPDFQSWLNVDLGWGSVDFMYNLYVNDEIVTDIVIPEGTTEIQDQQFQNCVSIVSVTLPESLVSIGRSAFFACSNLTSIDIPNNVEYIGDNAFGRTRITSIKIPDKVTKILTSTFYQCSRLIDVTIGKGVTSIGSPAFISCFDIVNLIIPENVSTISSRAFEKCTSLETLVLPQNLQTIESNAFASCNSLKTIYSYKPLSDISINNGNDCLSEDICYIYSETSPVQDGKYWHYDSDGITPVIWTGSTLTTVKNIEECSITSFSNAFMEIGKEVTITATTANGYTFVGWFDGDELLTNSLEYKFIMPEISQVYTAKWIKVSIEKNIEEAGTVSELNSKYIFCEEVSITSTTNDGYTWLGWYEGENLVSSNLNLTFKMPDKNTTFTAKWETKQYNITLNLQGGSLDGEPVTSIALGETKNLGVPSKTDYVFGGWFTLDGTEIADADGNMLSGWSILDNTEIFAKWLRTLSFNSNGGDFVESLFVEPGTVVDLITPKKTGHSFDGWSINTEIYKDSFEMPDSNVELTANWTANNYYILQWHKLKSNLWSILQHSNSNKKWLHI